LVVGNTAQVAVGGVTPEMQVLGTAPADSAMTVGTFSADAASPLFYFVKSRNGTIGSNTIVQDNDRLGQIIWCADDGNDYTHDAARIFAEVDGTPGENDLPTALVFSTTADGEASVSERMRINASGVGIGKVPANGTLDVTNGLSNGPVAQFSNSHASTPLGVDIDFSGAAPDNTTQWFVRGQDSGAVEFHIYSDGSFAQVSDINTKENVKPAESYTVGLKTLEVIEYNKKNDVDNRLHIGFSAQEVQKVYPHLVTKAQFDEEFDDDGELIEKPDQLMLNSIGLVPILWRNVQELEARVAALEFA